LFCFCFQAKVVSKKRRKTEVGKPRDSRRQELGGETKVRKEVGWEGLTGQEPIESSFEKREILDVKRGKPPAALEVKEVEMMDIVKGGDQGGVGEGHDEKDGGRGGAGLD